MENKEKKYWYEQLDRFGLFFSGMFLGALMELTGITHLGIIVSVTLMTCTAILMGVLKRTKKERKR